MSSSGRRRTAVVLLAALVTAVAVGSFLYVAKRREVAREEAALAALQAAIDARGDVRGRIEQYQAGKKRFQAAVAVIGRPREPGPERCLKAATSGTGIARLEIEGSTINVVADEEGGVASLVRALREDGCIAWIAEQGHPAGHVAAKIEVSVPRPTPTVKP